MENLSLLLPLANRMRLHTEGRAELEAREETVGRATAAIHLRSVEVPEVMEAREAKEVVRKQRRYTELRRPTAGWADEVAMEGMVDRRAGTVGRQAKAGRVETQPQHLRMARLRRMEALAVLPVLRDLRVPARTAAVSRVHEVLAPEEAQAGILAARREARLPAWAVKDQVGNPMGRMGPPIIANLITIESKRAETS